MKLGLSCGTALAVILIASSASAADQLVATAAGKAGVPAAAAEATGSGATTAAGASGVAVEGLVVTGSRLRRTEYSSPDPISVITSEQAQLQGLASTANMLQRSSVAAGAFQTNDQLTGYVTNGGPGAQTISLRGLGDQRTLVLLNGRRTGPAGTGGTVGPIDLNVIPASAVDHVEILKDGASSVYGSDAVAGVVNIIFKKNTDGLQLDAYGNNTEHGGGNQYRVSADWGKTFSNGYINIAGEYYRQEVLRASQRDDTSCAADYLDTPDRSARIDYTDPYANNGNFYKCYNLVNNVAYASGRQFNPTTGAFPTTGAATTYVLQYLRPGVAYPTGLQGNNVPTSLAGIFARQSRAGFPATYPYGNYDSPYYQQSSVLSPDQRYSILLNGSYQITPGIEAYTELLYNRRNSQQYDARQLFPGISPANPNNIFAGTGLTPIYPVIALPQDSKQEVNYYHAVAGLRGDVSGLGFLNGWNWDLYGSFTRSQAKYQMDIIYNDRVDATTGDVACDPTADGNISGFSCSALPAGGIPWFSPRVMSGAFTDQERAFLFAKEGGTTRYDQAYVEGALGGKVITLPAGDVQTNVGFSLRHESIDDNPDRDIAQDNLWGYSSNGRTKGSDDIHEVFGEVSIPLLKDLPLVQDLSFDGSARYTHYKSYGGNTTYKVGLNWQVIPDVRLRGTYGTSFRAPALYELYLANQTSFLGQASIDPCVNYQDASSAQVRANCAAQGIPTEYNGSSPNGGGGSALITTGGGKGLLKAETSKAYTLGVIFTPKFLQDYADVSISVDYFSFDVSNEVRTYGSLNIVTQCYKSSDFPNSPFCSLFTRDLNPASPSYLNVTAVNDSYINVADQKNRGIDLNILISHDFGDWGKLTLDGQATWQLEDQTMLLGGSTPEDYLGTTYGWRGPDFTAIFNLRYDRGPWTVHWGAQMIGKGSDSELAEGDTFYNSRYANTPAGVTSSDCTATPNACVYYKQYTEFTVFHDLSVRRKWEDQGLMTEVGVQNVFDERPPGQSVGQFRTGTAALNAYDVLGRRFFINVSKTW
jgi:iron complex outermembrane receptor protein